MANDGVGNTTTGSYTKIGNRVFLKFILQDEVLLMLEPLMLPDFHLLLTQMQVMVEPGIGTVMLLIKLLVVHTIRVL